MADQTEAPDLPTDAIATHIHAELLAWLTDTAATAASLDQVVEMTAGATAGLAEFLWRNRGPGVTREGVLQYMMEAAASCLIQFDDSPPVRQ